MPFVRDEWRRRRLLDPKYQFVLGFPKLAIDAGTHRSVSRRILERKAQIEAVRLWAEDTLEGDFQVYEGPTGMGIGLAVSLLVDNMRDAAIARMRWNEDIYHIWKPDQDKKFGFI